MLDRSTLPPGKTVWVKSSLPDAYDQSLIGCSGVVHTIHVDSVSVNIRGVLRRLPFAHLALEPEPVKE